MHERFRALAIDRRPKGKSESSQLVVRSVRKLPIGSPLANGRIVCLSLARNRYSSSSETFLFVSFLVSFFFKVAFRRNHQVLLPLFGWLRVLGDFFKVAFRRNHQVLLPLFGWLRVLGDDRAYVGGARLLPSFTEFSGFFVSNWFTS